MTYTVSLFHNSWSLIVILRRAKCVIPRGWDPIHIRLTPTWFRYRDTFGLRLRGYNPPMWIRLLGRRGDEILESAVRVVAACIVNRVLAPVDDRVGRFCL